MTCDELIDAVIAEVSRVFGDDPGFDGEDEQYRWLERVYGITEEEDVQLQFILEWFRIYGPEETDLDEDDPDDAEMLDFLHNETAVAAFLEVLLAKYRGHEERWPR